MPTENEGDPVIGDGVISLPFPEGEDMAADLPEGVAGHLITESVGNIQLSNATSRNVHNLASGVLQAAMARNFDELGTVESRATSGVLGTPVASPTTQ